MILRHMIADLLRFASAHPGTPDYNSYDAFEALLQIIASSNTLRKSPLSPRLPHRHRHSYPGQHQDL